MAGNATAKRQNAAQDMIGAVDDIMRGVYALDTFAKAFQSAGLTFEDADFTEVQTLAHLDAAKMNAILSNGPAIRTYLETNYIADVLNAVRLR